MKKEVTKLIEENKMLPLYIRNGDFKSSVSKFEGLRMKSKSHQTGEYLSKNNYKPTLLYGSI